MGYTSKGRKGRKDGEEERGRWEREGKSRGGEEMGRKLPSVPQFQICHTTVSTNDFCIRPYA